jgi:Rha family phage regulatory protein
MNTLPSDFSWDAVTTHNQRVVTTSMWVAKVFGKSHKNVLRDIQKLLDHRLKSEAMIDNFLHRHFQPMMYQDTAGKGASREQSGFYMDKDGFTLLVMGYSGPKALLFKVAYINQFNDMAARLRQNDRSRVAQAEAAYYARYPKDREIRHLALVSEPYWMIAYAV